MNFIDWNYVQKKASTLSYFFALCFAASLFFSITATAIFFIAGIICWFISGRLINNNFKNINLLLLAQVLLLLIYYFIHEEEDRKFVIFLKDTFKFYIPWFWFTSLFTHLKGKQTRRFNFVIIIASAVNSLVVILQNFNLVPLAGKVGPSGFTGQPYTAGGLLIVSLFICLHLLIINLRSKHVRKKLLAPTLFVLSVQLMAFFFLGQRAIWAAVSIGLFFWLVLNIKRIGLLKIISLLVVSFLGGLVSYFTSPKFKTKLNSIFHLVDDKVGLGCRLDLWKANWQSFLQHPIIGPGRAVKFQCLTDKLGHAHNIYLQQLVTNGLIGFSLWAFTFLQLFARLIKRKNHSAYLCAFIALLFEGLLENWYGDSEVISIFWVFMAMALA
jgi:O-antigen ligase